MLSPSVGRIHMSRDLGCGRVQRCNLNLVFLYKQDPDHPSKENLMDLEVKVGYSGDTCLCTILKSGLTTRQHSVFPRQVANQRDVMANEMFNK